MSQLRGIDRPAISFTGYFISATDGDYTYQTFSAGHFCERCHWTRLVDSRYYFEVLREVIINVIVHRDYNIEQANINVKIGDDKIVVESPGLMNLDMSLDMVVQI